jgi:hypothetical protein
METIKIDIARGTAEGFGRIIGITCIVRNEINGWRPNKKKLPDICRSIPGNYAIMPRTFPIGLWTVGEPRRVKGIDTEVFGYWFIPTDAWQILPVWELTDSGLYKRATEHKIIDRGYGAHYSPSTSTEGCIRYGTQEDCNWHVTQIKNAQADGEQIKLKVV